MDAKKKKVLSPGGGPARVHTKPGWA